MTVSFAACGKTKVPLLVPVSAESLAAWQDCDPSDDWSAAAAADDDHDGLQHARLN